MLVGQGDGGRRYVACRPVERDDELEDLDAALLLHARGKTIVSKHTRRSTAEKVDSAHLSEKVNLVPTRGPRDVTRRPVPLLRRAPPRAALDLVDDEPVAVRLIAVLAHLEPGDTSAVLGERGGRGGALVPDRDDFGDCVGGGAGREGDEVDLRAGVPGLVELWGET